MAGDQSYYQALCFEKLGHADRAKGLFQSLVDSGQAALSPQTTAAVPGGRGGSRCGQTTRMLSATARYTLGLGYLGLNDQSKAKAELTQAVDLSPDLVGTRTALAALK
jgi:tetratricopeptide (TPR) repeat protein